MRLACALALAASFLLAACGEDGTMGAETGGATSSGDPSSSSTGDATTQPATSSDGTSTGEAASTGADDTTAATLTTTGDSGSETTADTTGGGATQVVFETTLGTIVIELDEDLAPITSANFIAYVEAGFYDGTDGMGATTFHRVIPGFVIQGGGLTETLQTKATMAPIVNEFGNGLLNARGTISMARTTDPDSATSQFFINLVDNGGLDVPPGYAVFGEVVEGMEVVDAIAAVPTTTMGPYEDVPVDPISVTSAMVQTVQ
jgi:peptidyl-prolyl cis-trans isomerase A (cyclophilin A)